jgi:glycosyltransferase involved in cell wall biosynthesis
MTDEWQSKDEGFFRIVHTDIRRSGWVGENSRIFDLSRNLAGRGHRVWVAAPQTSLLLERCRAAGLEVWPHLAPVRGFHPVRYYRAARAFADFLRRERIDIVHTHASSDTWLAAAAVRMAYRPILILTRHNTKRLKNSWLNRRLYRRCCRKVIAISESVAEVMVQAGLLPRDRIEVIPDGVDFDRFDPEKVFNRNVWRRKLGVPDGAPLIVDVSRLSRNKGHENLLDAAALILKQFPSARFAVAGKGDRRKKELRQRTLQMGLDTHVQWLDQIEDVPGFLAAADVFLHCSLAEGLGTAVIEALAMKVPTVATAVGGVPDIVENGRTGLLAPAGDPGKAAEAVLELLRNPQRAAELAENERPEVLGRFSIERLVERTESVYREALSKG